MVEQTPSFHISFNCCVMQINADVFLQKYPLWKMLADHQGLHIPRQPLSTVTCLHVTVK